MTITDMVAAAYKNSVDHGFWDPNENPENVSISSKLALIHSEVSEALEEHRNPDGGVMRYREDGKPEGFASELADILIRVGDLAGARGIDLETAVAEKMRFNAGRPRLHGKRL